MSVPYTTYAGPFIRCRLPTTITTLRTVCSNGKCTESNKPLLKVTRFCSECGSATISREFQKNPGEELFLQFMRDTKNTLLGYNTAIHDVYVVSNGRRKSGRAFWLPCGEVLDLADVNMDAEIKQFREQFAQPIQRAMVLYGEDRVTVSWAVINWEVL